MARNDYGTALDLAARPTFASAGIAKLEEVELLGKEANRRTTTGADTLVLADLGKTLVFNAASDVAETVPPNSSVAFPVGTYWLQRFAQVPLAS